MAWTSDDLTRIEKAIASGTTKVKFSDKEVTYRTIDELFRVRDEIKKAIGQNTKKTRVLAKFSKGTD